MKKFLIAGLVTATAAVGLISQASAASRYCFENPDDQRCYQDYGNAINPPDRLLQSMMAAMVILLPRRRAGIIANQTIRSLMTILMVMVLIKERFSVFNLVILETAAQTSVTLCARQVFATFKPMIVRGATMALPHCVTVSVCAFA